MRVDPGLEITDRACLAGSLPRCIGAESAGSRHHRHAIYFQKIIAPPFRTTKRWLWHEWLQPSFHGTKRLGNILGRVPCQNLGPFYYYLPTPRLRLSFPRLVRCQTIVNGLDGGWLAFVENIKAEIAGGTRSLAI
jgi:hypothetical protein